MIINGKWRRSLLDTRSYRGAEVNSEHHLVIAKIRLKLKKAVISNTSTREIIDIKLLNNSNMQRRLCIELRRRFSVLENQEQNEQTNLQNQWKNIKQVCQQTAEKIIEYRKRNDKQWLSQSTWNARKKKISERKS